MSALNVLCAQLTRDLFVIAKFLLHTFHLKFMINANYEQLLIEMEFNIFIPCINHHGQSVWQLVYRPPVYYVLSPDLPDTSSLTERALRDQCIGSFADVIHCVSKNCRLFISAIMLLNVNRILK